MFALIICATIQPAIAYFTTYVRAKGGHEVTFGDTTKITEEFSDWTKKVTITNEAGSAPVFIRAKVLYEGKCRSYDHDTTSDKGEVITALRDLALPMKQDEWTADNAPKKGDFVEVNKGAFKEWGTVIDFRPNNLGTDILFRYDS